MSHYFSKSAIFFLAITTFLCNACQHKSKEANVETQSVDNQSGTIYSGDSLIMAIGVEEQTVTIRWAIGTTEEQKNSVKSIVKNLIYVEGGTFTMGCQNATGLPCESYELPAHSVSLHDFYIYKFEVMQKTWMDIMETEIPINKRYQYPQTEISWNDCQIFIQRLNNMTGLRFRLPTEAEWEYAARGGNRSKGFVYAGSNNSEEIGWSNRNSNHDYHAISNKAANELGLYDMSGNVWEWCADFYAQYSSNAQNNPTGPETGSNHVYRGGSYIDSENYLRVTSRNSGFPDYKMNCLGFRLVLDL